MSDYYVYGMQMPGRSYQSTSSSYRYGYQGSEKDDEIAGKGNSYTTFFRQLDPRLGRWFSPDPVFQPWQSPYTSMDNNPINLTDVMGDKTHGDGGDPASHEVKKDETLGGIAKKYDGVSADDIYEANKELIGSDKDLIKPGQKLEIPGTKEVKEEIQIEKKEPGWSVKVPEPTTELSEGESKEEDVNIIISILETVDEYGRQHFDPIAAQELGDALGYRTNSGAKTDPGSLPETGIKGKAYWQSGKYQWQINREKENEAIREKYRLNTNAAEDIDWRNPTGTARSYIDKRGYPTIFWNDFKGYKVSSHDTVVQILNGAYYQKETPLYVPSLKTPYGGYKSLEDTFDIVNDDINRLMNNGKE